MPEYSYICNCGAKRTVVKPMSDATNPVNCDCGKVMSRDYKADAVMDSDREYHRPLVSDSLAINPEQITEHKKKFPNVEITREGQPVFRTFRQHDNYLKATGFEKKSQRRVLI